METYQLVVTCPDGRKRTFLLLENRLRAYIEEFAGCEMVTTISEQKIQE